MNKIGSFNKKIDLEMESLAERIEAEKDMLDTIAILLDETQDRIAEVTEQLHLVSARLQLALERLDRNLTNRQRIG